VILSKFDQNSDPNLLYQLFEMVESILIEQMETSPATTKVKRSQVPKACTNCRKNHAGCDLKRPCKRCSQNGIEDSCSDVPRKKRVLKRRNPEEISMESILETDLPQNQDQSNDKVSFDAWEDAYNLMTGNGTMNGLAAPLSPLNSELNFEYQPPTLILDYPADDSSSMSSVSSSYSSPMTTIGRDPLPYFNFNPSSNNLDLGFLVDQVTELKENNKNLERKLMNVTSELSDLKTKQNTNPYVLLQWHSFQSQPDLAISVWKHNGNTNILTECNDKFVQMMGHPIDYLQKGFTCRQMMPKKMKRVEELEEEEESCNYKLLCPDKSDEGDRQWPKRTTISTANGSKDVFMTLTPVADSVGVVRYFISYILEVL